ncbi:hypothetical protein BJ165DRAFT_1598416 [Panaeolus papilionaceus]|nr:hypothetical protein BJ165DRAFT_1598416 [Panaeolus papilionaceus]
MTANPLINLQALNKNPLYVGKIVICLSALAVADGGMGACQSFREYGWVEYQLHITTDGGMGAYPSDPVPLCSHMPNTAHERPYPKAVGTNLTPIPNFINQNEEESLASDCPPTCPPKSSPTHFINVTHGCFQLSSASWVSNLSSKVKFVGVFSAIHDF